ncbi:MAG: hypothetical protein E6G78_16910 [Alphaproteobacteria bacterium]|nr:MAG: hypothetical protein E6G78_16910 [Alphaproteobacteria bacterium]
MPERLSALSPSSLVPQWWLGRDVERADGATFELIIGLAARHKLPAVYYRCCYAASGGLIPYGYDLFD